MAKLACNGPESQGPAASCSKLNDFGTSNERSVSDMTEIVLGSDPRRQVELDCLGVESLCHLLKCASRVSCHLAGSLLAWRSEVSLLFGVSVTPVHRYIRPFEQHLLCPGSSRMVAVKKVTAVSCRARQLA